MCTKKVRYAYMYLRMNSKTFGNVYNVTNSRTNEIMALEASNKNEILFYNIQYHALNVMY